MNTVNGDTIAVTLAWSPGERKVRQRQLQLPLGATVQMALVSANRAAVEADRIGVFGQPVGLDHVLADGDRLELYRPLRVDPKDARRRRFAAQGAGPAGLFAKKSGN